MSKYLLKLLLLIKKKAPQQGTSLMYLLSLLLAATKFDRFTVRVHKRS
jgi:hypothetical protein